jgi:hypothetical protein
MGHNGSTIAERLTEFAGKIRAELGRNWRFACAAVLALAAVTVAIELSDRQGRMDIPAGYAVKMVCEPDPESHLWSGGCDRVADDIARTDKPSFGELYRAFVTVHHRRIPSPALERQFRHTPCEDGFDLEGKLAGTRYVFVPLRPHFAGTCTVEHVEAVKGEIDARDRALLAIEREGLSHEALFAGTLANLTEPLVVLGAAALVAALVIL